MMLWPGTFPLYENLKNLHFLLETDYRSDYIRNWLLPAQELDRCPIASIVWPPPPQFNIVGCLPVRYWHIAARIGNLETASTPDRHSFRVE